MYKLVVLAVLAVATQASLVPLGATPYAYQVSQGYPAGALAYAGAPLAYAGAPLGYAAAHIAAPAVAVAAPAPAAYALPPVREIAEAPIVETAVEPVEQHGYSIRY